MTPTDKQIEAFEKFLQGDSLDLYQKRQSIKVGVFLLSLIDSPLYERKGLTFEKMSARNVFFNKIYQEYKTNEGKITFKDDSLIMELTVSQFNQVVQDAVWTTMLDILPKGNRNIQKRRKYEYKKRIQNATNSKPT